MSQMRERKDTMVHPDGAQNSLLFEGLAEPVLPTSSPHDQDTPGFFIRQVVATGARVQPAVLEFTRGVNVISGPSNTGKSFTFYLIDYLLGARELGKEVPEANGYDYAYAEIETYTGVVFTIRRSLHGGKVLWYNVPFDRITTRTPFVSLSPKHSATKRNTLSGQLLALSNLTGRLLRANRNNQTRSLSFRDVLHFALVDEVRIITDKSPISGPNSNAKTQTVDRAVFRLLVTGLDSSGLIELEDAITSRRILTGQAELIDQMIAELPAVPVAFSADLLAMKERITDQTGELTERLARTGGSIDELLSGIEGYQDTIREKKSRLLVIRELLERFSLLRASFQTDLARLSFSREGSFLVDQLRTVECPVCGQGLENGPLRSTEEEYEEDGAGFRAACEHEADKLKLQLSDLDATMASMNVESESLRAEIREYELSLRALQLTLRLELQPRQQELIGQLAEASEARSELLRIENLLNQRLALQQRRVDLERALITLIEPRDRSGGMDEFPIGGLMKEVRDLLEAWKYPELEQVVFDFKKMDLVVSGKPRAAQGKGVRAVLYSAFLIGLLHHCRHGRTPHPGFVILDSPLTTYRGPEDLPQHDRDEVSPGIQAAFFRSLAHSLPKTGATEQIIIFENKEPPPDTWEEITYIRFAGKAGGERSGFFPV